MLRFSRFLFLVNFQRHLHAKCVWNIIKQSKSLQTRYNRTYIYDKYHIRTCVYVFLRPPRSGLRGHTYRLLQGPRRLPADFHSWTVIGSKSSLQHLRNFCPHSLTILEASTISESWASGLGKTNVVTLPR